MVLLILTNISSPAEVGFVDCLDKEIHCVGWLVFQVKILSFLLGSFYLYIFGFCWSLSCNMFSLHSMMASNFIIFHFSCIECFGLLNVIMLSLSSMEALYIMVVHCALNTCFARDRLDETNHCLITF